MRRAEEFRYVVLAAQREGNRLLSSALEGIGLTPAWAEAIMILEESGPITVKELGELLVCESSHPSRLVERMVVAGLVERAASSTDSRAVNLSLSATAHGLVPKIRSVEDAVYGLIDSALPENVLATVIEALSIVVSGSHSGLALEKRRHHQQVSDTEALVGRR